jgi:CheY-specific phosphatase CheX
MMKTLTTAMTTSISEVMETMFYMPVEFGAETGFTQSGMDKNPSSMACQLQFSGDVSGKFTLLIPRDLLAEVTENFVGEPRESIEDELLSGTLTEMLNMISGNALSKMESKVPFELGIPEVVTASEIPKDQSPIFVETTQSQMAVFITMD